VYDTPVVMQALNLNQQGLVFHDESFRDHEVNSHTVWVKYFTRETEMMMEQVQLYRV